MFTTYLPLNPMYPLTTIENLGIFTIRSWDRERIGRDFVIRIQYQSRISHIKMRPVMIPNYSRCDHSEANCMVVFLARDYVSLIDTIYELVIDTRTAKFFDFANFIQHANPDDHLNFRADDLIDRQDKMWLFIQKFAVHRISVVSITETAEGYYTLKLEHGSSVTIEDVSHDHGNVYFELTRWPDDYPISLIAITETWDLPSTVRDVRISNQIVDPIASTAITVP